MSGSVQRQITDVYSADVSLHCWNAHSEGEIWSPNVTILFQTSPPGFARGSGRAVSNCDSDMENAA